MDIGILIMIAVVGLIVTAILLKICSKFFTLNLILLVAAGVGLIVSSFSMPEQTNGWNWDWIVPQALLVYLYFEMLCADFAFDKEEYVSTTVTEHWDGSYTASSKLESKSAFWGTVGSGIVAAIFIVGLNYVIFETHAIALGIVGCLATAWAAFQLIKYTILRIRAKRGRRNYY